MAGVSISRSSSRTLYPEAWDTSCRGPSQAKAIAPGQPHAVAIDRHWESKLSSVRSAAVFHQPPAGRWGFPSPSRQPHFARLHGPPCTGFQVIRLHGES